MDTFCTSESRRVIFERDPDLSWEQKKSWEQVDHEGNTLQIVGCSLPSADEPVTIESGHARRSVFHLRHKALSDGIC